VEDSSTEGQSEPLQTKVDKSKRATTVEMEKEAIK